MKKILLLCVVVSSFLVNEAFSQERTISGTVKAADNGSAVPGVNVILKGTTVGTVTDIDGKYKLEVPAEGGTLVFSFIGLATQEVDIGQKSVIDVNMQAETTQLNEVVVTALGVERAKNELPYAAQQVKGDAVTATQDFNLINSLSGKVAGVDVKRNNTMGGSTNILIRGFKSIYGNNQPLFVVDGVPVSNVNTNSSDERQGFEGYDYGNGAADINPDDISSINVLKGAAATALYGSRASNGVIMITTKKGRQKQGIGLTLGIGGTTGSYDPSTFVKYQKQYGAGYGQYYEDPSGYFLYRDKTDWSYTGASNSVLVVPMSEDASYGHIFDPNLQVYQWDAFDPASPNFGKPKPWVPAAHDNSYMFQHPKSYNASILLNAKTDKGYWKFGYTRNDQKGLMPNSKLTKDYFNFGASYDLAKNLTLESTVNYTKETGLGRYGMGYANINLMTTFRQWCETNNDILELKDAYFRNHKNVTWNWTDPTILTPIYWDNPWFTRYEDYENDSRDRIFGNSAITYRVTDWLNVIGRVSLDSYSGMEEERHAVGSVDVSSYRRYNYARSENNYDLMANFSKSFTNFSITGLLGGNIRQEHQTSIDASTNGGLILPEIYALFNSVNPINAPAEFDGKRHVDGYFASATFGVKEMVFVDGSFRRDYSSTLPKNSNAYNYGSISGSFLFSKLLQNVSWLNVGKVRLNYAEVGNDAPIYSVNDVYDYATPFNGNPIFSAPGTKNNTNLKPERTKSLEAGIEMSFFEDRLGFDVTNYDDRTVDQIIPIPVSRATGYNSIYLNAGEVQNKGWEVNLYGTPVKAGDFSWTINLNWTRNRNKVISLPEGVSNLQLGGFQNGVSINATLGKPYGTIKGSNFVYNDKGQKVVSSNGRYEQNANEIIGNVNPDWVGGINNSFKYKGITLSFLIDIRHGGQLYSLDQSYGLATGLYPETAGNNDLGNPLRAPLADGGGYIRPGVKEDGSPNDVRVSGVNFGLFGYRYAPNAAFIYDASYVKLREVLLTYSLPQSLISKMGAVNGIDVSLTGQNLWIIHKNLPYADPEDSFGSGNLSMGNQGGSYPSVRTYGVDLKVKF
jgi:TonB-linked SusC/RagA family outer membrane protein